ncbi:MAG: VWA domain-containing protein [Thiohalorhabdus sp.]|uniref:VWA domain-containing protein n=1 Tax=Thiohalorhabdus sp. TaxID=3094134 RepID=UPI00397FE54E
MKRLLLLLLIPTILVLTGCPRSAPPERGVYLLLDTSGTYTEELDKAQRIISYVLSRMNPGDHFAVARIDTGSFSEKDIIARTTFDERPSQANQEKREFREKINEYVEGAESAQYTDITGGMLQGIEWLNEVDPSQKVVLVFSDMKEDLPDDYVRDVDLELSGIEVAALNVTKLSSDIVDPRKYMSRVDNWRDRVEDAGGQWRMINDLDNLTGLFSG